MVRASRLIVPAAILASLLTGGTAPLVRVTHAASKQILTVIVANPYYDPAQYLNDKTKKATPDIYADAQMTQAVFNMFYKQHPDYVIQPHDWGWSDQLRQKILLNVAAGNVPDVIVGEDFIPEFAREGILAPIPGASLSTSLASGPLSGGMYNGKIYAVPAETGIFELYYNKALFRKAGLDPNAPPTTWDQWLADSKKIAALGNGISGTTIEGGTGLGAAFRLAPFMRQLGGDFTSRDGSKITFNSPANLKALTFLRQLAQTAAPGVTALTDEGKFFGSTWWANKAGFVVDGPWEVGSSVQNKLDFGVAPLPIPAGGHPANVVVGNQMFAVTKLAKHQQAAFDYLRILASEAAARLNYRTTGRLPANLKVLNTDVQNSGGPITVFVKGLQVPGITPLPSYLANPQKVWDEWYNVQLAALATTQSIPSALSQAQSNAEALLQQ